jgi:hypothetical protein
MLCYVINGLHVIFLNLAPINIGLKVISKSNVNTLNFSVSEC